MLRCAAFALTLWAAIGSAGAQVTRLFPPTALRGELAVVQPPDVRLNGRAARLAPGVRIRNEENRFEVYGTLAGRRLVVNYTTDAGGELLDVWILTPSERAKRPWPTTQAEATAWQFDPIAQIWTRP